jgi:hypothetical protein
MMHWTDWWKQKEQEYPLLAHAARHILCIPATSVASERVFSHAGRVVNHLRASLSPAKAARLTFMHTNKQYL